jgi:hypothetical protein
MPALGGNQNTANHYTSLFVDSTKQIHYIRVTQCTVFSFLSKNMKFKIYRTIIFPVVRNGTELLYELRGAELY